MSILRLLSSAEQVAQYLRGQLMERVWTGMMPGGNKLARELGVGANTIEAAPEAAPVAAPEAVTADPAPEEDKPV